MPRPQATRWPAADPIPSRTCNGRRSVMRGLGTGGTVKLVFSNPWSLVKHLYTRNLGQIIFNTPNAFVGGVEARASRARTGRLARAL